MHPFFKVEVKPLKASNGVTYVVYLFNNNRSIDASIWDTEGVITPINRNDIDEANSEGQLWAEFLGVEFTPCLPVVDGVIPNTVPEYGDSIIPKVIKKSLFYKQIKSTLDLFAKFIRK